MDSQKIQQVVAYGLAIFVLSCASNTIVETKVAPSKIQDGGGCAQITSFFQTELDPYWLKTDAAWEEYLRERSSVSVNGRKLFAGYQKLRDDRALLSRAEAIEVASRGVSDDSCPDRPRLVRALELLHRSVLSAAVQSKEANTEVLFRDFVRRNAAFGLALPGEKSQISPGSLYSRLGNVDDRRQRENLAKLFQGGRAKKWMDWGFKDLVKARNEEAIANGFKSYVEYQLSKIGWPLEDYQATMKRIHELWMNDLKAKFKAWGKNLGIVELQFYDVPAFTQAGLRAAFKAGSKNLLSNFPEDGTNWLCTQLGMPFVSVSSGKNDDDYWVAMIRQWQVSEEKASHIFFETIDPVEAGAMGFAISELVLAPSFLKRWSDSPARRATVVGRTIVVDPKNLLPPSVTRLIWAAMRADLESQIYEHPDEDYADLWAKLFQENWGVELLSFYSDWDDDSFLEVPGTAAGKVLAALTGHAIAKGLSEQFPPGCCSRAIGDKLRQVGFATGREYDYKRLLERLGIKDQLPSRLVEQY